jgi:hypothetical protein
LGIIHRRGKELGGTTRRFIELLKLQGQRVSPTTNGVADSDTRPTQNGQSKADGNGSAHPAAEKISEPGQADRLRRAAYAKAK